MVAEITALRSEPNQHSNSAIQEAKDTLVDLETRIQAVEAAIPPRGYIN